MTDPGGPGDPGDAIDQGNPTDQDEPGDATDQDERPDEHGSNPARSERGALYRALDRLRTDPVALVPFLLAGLVCSAVDWLRRRDPVPVELTEALAGEGIDVTIAFFVYPTPETQTTQQAGALFDLHPEYLAWVLGLELLVVLAVSIAGAVTVARVAGRPLTRRAVASYVGFVVATTLVFRSVTLLVDAGVLPDEVGFVPGVFFLLVVLYAFVRLFAVPGLLVDGDSIPRALRRGLRLTAGDGWALVQLVLVFGLAAWLATAIPVAGAVVGGLVAAVHAATLATYLESAGVFG